MRIPLPELSAPSLLSVQPRLGRNTWPPDEATARVWEDVEWLAAFRDSDLDQLLSYAQSMGMGGTRQYVTVPVPRLISRLKANLLFGESPEILASSASDQPLLDALVDENDLHSELNRAALIASSEGEVWGRICVDPVLLDVPILEFCSRRWVLPRFSGAYGRFLEGATFFSEIVDGRTVWRILEDYGPGYVASELWRGTSTELGQRRPLTDRPETADLADRPYRETGADQPLCVFIPNAIDADPTRGVSDYLGVILAFLAINETVSTGQANLRLVGLKRLFVDGRYKNSQGNLPGGQDVFWSDAAMVDALGQNGGIHEAQYNFESSELTAWLEHLIDLTITMAGVAPASVGRQQGSENTRSGTALRLRMTHTLMEAAGTGRSFDRALSKLLRLAGEVDKAIFSRPWSNLREAPSIHRADGLPNDANEQAQQISQLRTAKSMSTEQAVRVQHPDWSESQVQSEVERIHEEQTPPPNAAAPNAEPPGRTDAERGRTPNPQGASGGQ